MSGTQKFTAKNQRSFFREKKKKQKKEEMKLKRFRGRLLIILIKRWKVMEIPL